MSETFATFLTSNGYRALLLFCDIAFTVGDIKQLLYPTDSLGNFCGYDEFR